MSERSGGGAADRIGPYEVLRYLTAGGMADLYLVRAPGRREPLVVKRVQSRFAGSERVLDMFRDEGQIGGLLDHPNLVRVVDTGDAGGAPYIAMEYIAGHDLVEVLRRCAARHAPFPRVLGVALCAQVARGLAYAHDLRGARGEPLDIVHCDISPGNVMLSWRGAVKLVDFGVARAKIELHCQDRGVAGKHGYMAPEQIRGAAVDRRADLFSLGVILYELTCGRRLFRGAPEVVMRQIVEEPVPPPREIVEGYPAELEAIVMRALHRDPAARYQTAEALRVDLAEWLRGAGRPHGRRDLARFLREIFEHPDPEMEDEEPASSDTLDLPSPPPQDEHTTEAALPEGVDEEDGQLTRHDNPLLRPFAPPLPPPPRDPERTGLLVAPPRRRRHHSGGITTHMLGDGATHSVRREEPQGAKETAERTAAVVAPASSRALVRRAAPLTLAALLLGLLAYYLALR